MQHTKHQGSDQPEFGKGVVYNEFFLIGNNTHNVACLTTKAVYHYTFSINIPHAVSPGPKAMLNTSFPLGMVSSFTMACQT